MYLVFCLNERFSYVISHLIIVRVLSFEVDKPFIFSIKTTNVVKYTKSNIQNIEAPNTNNSII